MIVGAVTTRPALWTPPDVLSWIVVSLYVSVLFVSIQFHSVCIKRGDSKEVRCHVQPVFRQHAVKMHVGLRGDLQARVHHYRFYLNKKTCVIFTIHLAWD